ncbi:MAG: biotin--[acetyl-CoA-carboxylase] ligase [Blastocatellia bacterium]|nr:biotin--[acetyl-CoA-carboxylase] ligase [Blastocatellia bacterium]
MNFNILRFDTIGSTNTEAINQARLGAEEGLCIIARQQNAGRGRQGRAWISEKDAGLYFSVVLRPGIEIRFLPLITLMAGVAVFDTLQECDLKPDIKWVNDVLIGEKKISGILAETVETPKGLAVIVGIGINLKSSNFPPEIEQIATSIESETQRLLNAEEVAATLTKFFSYFYGILNDVNGPKNILGEWRRRSSYFSGKSVRVVLENETVTGTTDGLEDNGALRIKTSSGLIKIIQAGDVENLRTSGAGIAAHDS